MTYANPYPASLDVFGTKTDNVSTVYASAVNLCQNAVAALETKVGKNNSGDYSTPSFDYLVGDFFDDGSSDHQRKLWFYMNAAPTGWSITGLATNCVIGVKGGVYGWNVNGSTFYGQGSWTINDQVPDSHNHLRMKYDSTVSPYHWTYDDNGTTELAWKDDNTTQYFCSGVLGRVGNYANTDGDRNWIIAASLYTSNDSHSHAFSGNWRPAAAVGILCKYIGG